MRIRVNMGQAIRKHPLSLLTVYLGMAVVVVGILVHFLQLVDQSRQQTLQQIASHTRQGAEEFYEASHRIETMAGNLAVQYSLDHLESGPDQARQDLLGHLMLLVLQDAAPETSVELRLRDGHKILVSRDENGELATSSERPPLDAYGLVTSTEWELAGYQAIFVQPLGSPGNLLGNVIWRLPLAQLLGEALHQDTSVMGIRDWWLTAEGLPGENTMVDAAGDNAPLLQGLRQLMWEQEPGIITDKCPWHTGHDSYTALTPIRLGHFDLAILSSIDVNQVRGPLLSHSLILSVLFVALVGLVALSLRLHSDQRRTALQKLADDQAVIEGLFRGIDDLVFQQDLKGVYTDCNEAFAEFFGMRPDQIRGRTDDQIGIHRDQIPVTFEDRTRLKRNEKLKSEFWLDGPSGKELVDLRKHPLKHIDGEVHGVMGVGRVRTGEWKAAKELVRMKEELVAANRSLEEALNRATEFSQVADSANRAKSDFLANMSHEIRTPLGAVIGLTDLLAQTDCSHQQTGYLSKLDTAAHSLLHIINEILDFSKIEAGKMTIEETPFHLGEVISQVTEMFSERVMSRNLSFTSKREMIPDMLLGDPVRLRQILINLLGNALKFTEHGGITLTIGGGERLGDQIFLVFSVQDTGIGIAPEKLDELFSKFTQADNSTTRQYGGTGLGLSICQQLTDLMGGNIWVESEQGQGTTFHFTLPFRQMSEEQAESYMDEMMQREAAGLVKPGEPLAGLDILLVDDNEINREVISEFLIMRGARVDLAENGRQALGQVSDKKYDLVLMDMQMPVMDGPTASRAIRKNLGLKDLPIMALTANAQSEDKQACLDAGMNAFLAKPVDPATLGERILALVGSGDAGKLDRESAGPERRQPSPASCVAPPPADTSTPGLDLRQAMNRMGQKKALLTRLMRMFLDSHGDDLVTIQDALSAGRVQDAVRLAHTLKGTAGNLSAYKVHQEAADLEERLRDPDLAVETIPTSLVDAMVEIKDTMGTLLAGEEEPQAEALEEKPDMVKVEGLLTRLGLLIEENDVTAEDIFLEDRPHLQGAVPAQGLDALAAALMIYDFAEAGRLLAQVQEELTETNV